MSEDKRKGGARAPKKRPVLESATTLTGARSVTIRR